MTSVKHSKPQGVEAPAEEIAAPVAAPATPLAAAPATPVAAAPAHEAIAKIAYGYWAARGRTGGSADEDWVRAEAEYLSLSRE